MKRRRLIIRQLCELSRNGWQHAHSYDYEPLERELREIDRRAQVVRARLERAHRMNGGAR
jgi:transcription elongation GreA/GreB family factor